MVSEISPFRGLTLDNHKKQIIVYNDVRGDESMQNRYIENHNEEPMTLSKSITSVMRTRNMTPGNVTERMQSGRNRATLYRVLSGATQDPKLSTFLDICNALDVSPTDILQLAGLMKYRERRTDLLEVRLRQIFRRIQDMPEPTKRLAVTQFGMIADAIEDFERDQ